MYIYSISSIEGRREMGEGKYTCNVAYLISRNGGREL